jgi:hypothetical protein
MARISRSCRIRLQKGHTEVIKTLLTDDRANGNSISKRSCIWPICDTGDLEVVKLLLSKVDCFSGPRNIFVRACMRGYTEMVEMMLKDERIRFPILGFGSDWTYQHLKVVKILARDGRIDLSYESNYPKHEVRQFVKFECCKMKLFLCREICGDHLLMELSGRMGWSLINQL